MDKSLAFTSFVVIFCLFLFSDVTARLHLELENSDRPLCINHYAMLTCMHLDAVNTSWVFDAKANWKSAGKVLVPEGTLFISPQPARDQTHLLVSLKPSLFDGQQTLNFSCFLRVTNGTILESKEITIKPLLNPMTPSFGEVNPKPWSTDLRINHSRVCFTESERCSLNYVYTWQTPSQEVNSLTSSETEVVLVDLMPETQYTLNVTAVAVCDGRPWDITSDTATTYFTTGRATTIESFISASSNVDFACYGEVFEITCNHPDALAVHNQMDVFIDSSVSWKRDGMILPIDGDTYTVEKYRTQAKLVVNYKDHHYANPGTNNFSCFLRGANGTHFESPHVPVKIPGFPHSIEIDFTAENITWHHIAMCVPGISNNTQFVLTTKLPPADSFDTFTAVTGSDLNEAIASDDSYYVTADHTVGLAELINKLDISMSEQVFVILQQNSDKNKHVLKITELSGNEACFGHNYTLQCSTDFDSFTGCGYASTPTWYMDGKKFFTGTTSTVAQDKNTGSSTNELQINVTEENFKRNHTFHCGIQGTICQNSSKVTVAPLRHAFKPHNLAPSSTINAITLKWQHEKACFGYCTFNVSIMSGKDATEVDLTIVTANHEHTFKDLNPGTTYFLAVQAICDNRYHSDNATTESTTISIGAIVGPIIAIAGVVTVITVTVIIVIVIYRTKCFKTCNGKGQVEDSTGTREEPGNGNNTEHQGKQKPT